MLPEVAAGVVLLVGSVACVWAGAVRGSGRLGRLAFAAALACAAIAEFTGTASDWLWVAACALATAGMALLVLDRMAAVSRLSWLDAAMGASSSAAVAVSVGADAAAATAVAGAIGSLALSRWRPGWRVVVALVGLVAFGAGADLAPLAALALATAAWTRAERAEPGPEFSAIVLVAILAFATAALTLLTIGQFEAIDDVAVAVAAVTVLAGMARAGLTVTDRLRETQQQALTDDLTGLANRRHLMERLHAAVRSASEHGGEFAFLLIDLDGFKELNDTLGHHAGDEVLQQIGPRLAQLLRADDTLARLGGDEFAVVLAPGDETTASTAGLRLRAALERSFEVADIALHIDASVGIALFPEHATDAAGAAAARRCCDVRSEAQADRARGLPALARPPQPPETGADRGAPRRAGRRPARAALPAQGGPGDRGDPRGRGAGALAAPPARPAGTRPLPAADGAQRPDPGPDRVRARPRDRGDWRPAPPRVRPQRRREPRAGRPARPRPPLGGRAAA